MTLIQLEYVLAVAESRNFTTAAEKAHVTQPTLSMQIQKLEKELNVDIFDRSTHPIRITAIGHVILDQARVILKEAKRMSYIVSEQKNNLEGEFTIGMIPTVLPTLVPLIYKNFTAKFPNARLQIKELKTDAIISALEEDVIDFGIAVTPLNKSDIIELPLYYEPMVAFIPEHHRLSNLDEIKESDLDLKDLLLLEEGHCFRNNVLSICECYLEGGEDNIILDVDSGSFQTMIKLAKDGFGMTILPSLQAEDLSAEDSKYIKKFRDPAPTREVSLIFHKTQLRLKFVDEFKELIQSVVRGKIYLESDKRTLPVLRLK
ncbi:LysR family transcriptional regulator [Flavobacteriaceae bacterium Ap0902]|nr:LysR family transcriptional regulator [Flavobacteriaceae bacterium Ap0902]